LTREGRWPAAWCCLARRDVRVQPRPCVVAKHHDQGRTPNGNCIVHAVRSYRHCEIARTAADEQSPLPLSKAFRRDAQSAQLRMLGVGVLSPTSASRSFLKSCAWQLRRRYRLLPSPIAPMKHRATPLLRLWRFLSSVAAAAARQCEPGGGRAQAAGVSHGATVAPDHLGLSQRRQYLAMQRLRPLASMASH